MAERRVELYRDDAGEWRWRVVAPNGNKLADSGEGYEDRDEARAMAESLFPDMVVETLPERER